MISFDEFKKVEMRIGTVEEAARIDGSDKLLRLMVDFGAEKRQIVSGIAEFYAPEDMVGKQCPFVFNLEPRKFRGVESQGMIMAVDVDGGCVLMHPNKEVGPGALIK